MNVLRATGPQTLTGPNATGANQMMGLAKNNGWVYTPTVTGQLLVTVNGEWQCISGGDGGAFIGGMLNYGTGTAPSFAGGFTGINLPAPSYITGFDNINAIAGISTKSSMSMQGIAQVPVGTQAWFDLCLFGVGATGVFGFSNASITVTELAGVGVTGPTGSTGPTGPTGPAGVPTPMATGATAGPQPFGSAGMAGLGNRLNFGLTPLTSGRVHVSIDGFVQPPNNGIALTQLVYGTGTAPVVFGGFTGTTGAFAQEIGCTGTTGMYIPYSTEAILNLQPGIKYWFDLFVTGTLSNPSPNTYNCNAFEIPSSAGPTGPTGPTGPSLTYATGGTFTSNASFTGGSGTAFLMSGLGVTFTAKTTGKVLVQMQGTVVSANTLAGEGLILGIYYGPTGGVAPINKAGLTGSPLGPTMTASVPAVPIGSSDVHVPFHLTAFTQISTGQVYWFDVASAAATGTNNVNSIMNPGSTIVEIP
jgi:hypothetical protein